MSLSVQDGCEPFCAVISIQEITLTDHALQIAQDCVMGALRKKTVILVTHQVEFLHAVDLILVCVVTLLKAQVLEGI